MQSMKQMIYETMKKISKGKCKRSMGLMHFDYKVLRKVSC
jgi:hypothetical protein